MFALGTVEIMLVLPAIAILVLYLVIRLAVKHGSLDAQREREARDVRSQLNLGPERSPNSRS